MPFVRGMNYTNITSEEPVYKQSNSEWGSGRDIAYLIFSILQFITTCIGLVWANWIVKKREEKHQNSRSEKEEREKKERLEREEREKQERLEREERDKIAEIVSSEYTSIENEGVLERLRQCKERFGSMIIFCGTSCTVTGLNVLKYMLHPDKFEHFVKDSKALQDLIQDLDLVVKLFQIFRIKLPPNAVCPENIREELGPPVIELGQIASSLVTGKKYYTISKVLKYFDANQKTTSLGKQYQKDNQDIEEINANIPYIPYLRFGEMDSGPYLKPLSYDVTNFGLNQMRGKLQANQEQRPILSDLYLIECELRKEKPVDAEKLRHFASTMDVIWRSNFQELAMPDFRTFSKEDKLHANILHAVRVTWFKMVDGRAVAPFEELVKEMKKMCLSTAEAKKEECKNKLKVVMAHIFYCLEKRPTDITADQVQNLTLILKDLEKIC